MYVSPPARGLGVGRALVAEAASAAIELGFVQLRLQTLQALTAANCIYRGFGFVDILPYGDLGGADGLVTLGLDLEGSDETLKPI